MTAAKQYLAEHLIYLINFIKHGRLWITIILSIFAVLYNAGYLDKPAKERDVLAIAKNVESNKKRIGKVEDNVREISISIAGTAKELSSINKQIGFIKGDIRQILNSLLSQSRQ